MANRAQKSSSQALREAFGRELRRQFKAAAVRLSLPEDYAKENVNLQAYSEWEGGQIDIAPLFGIQTQLRPLFAKPGRKNAAIGDHPGFEHLRDKTVTERCPVTTMFMDIEGSSRLCLRHGVEKAFEIKNAFIKGAIEIVTAMDGHVHRIMGDAVLAYFGCPSSCPRQSAIDALNCAAILRSVAERGVAAELNQLGYGNDFGVRIGLDHGQKSDVLWGYYGYPGSGEITATSFYVDAAAKLQQSAGRHQMLIGDSLAKFLDLPPGLLTKRYSTQGSSPVESPYLSPNYEGADGKPINYRQHVFEADTYLRLGAYGHNDANLMPIASGPGIPFEIAIAVADTRNGPARPFPACSAPAPKGKWLRFTPVLPDSLPLPLKVVCTATNHGEEAFADKGQGRGSHSLDYDIKTAADLQQFSHWEQTKYLGLHYLGIDLSGANTRYASKVGVFIG